MTAPNLVNTSQVFMRSNIQVPIAGITDILETPAASNMVIRADVVTICNTTDTESSVDLYLTRSSSTYAIAKTVAVPAYSTMVVLDKDYPVYLEEGDKLQISGGSGLRAICSYTIISDTSITLPGRPTINTPPTYTSTYVTSASSGTDLTTYSFASTSLGGTNSNDIIVVCAGGEGLSAPGPLTTVSSLSVAGVSATSIVNPSWSSSQLGWASTIFAVTGISDSTGTISVTFSQTMKRGIISVYRITGTSGSIPSYTSDYQEGTAGLTATTSATAGSTTIACVYSDAGGLTLISSGTTSPADYTNTGVESTNGSWAVGSHNSSSSESVTSTTPTATDEKLLCQVTFT